MNKENSNISWSQVEDKIWADLLREHPEYDRRHPDYKRPVRQPHAAPVDPSASEVRIVCRNTAW